MRKVRSLALKFGTLPYYAVRTAEEVYTFAFKKKFQKSVEDSREIYNQYDDREQKDYINDRRWECVLDGKVQVLGAKEIRQHYLNYLYAEIDELKPQNGFRILEVGCGNCINLVNLKERYPDAEIHGIDVSENRIETSKKFWGESLEGVSLSVRSITKRTPFEKGYFNVVFSMHCIEQISQDTELAINEMLRITGTKTVMIEPVYENCNLAQKLYLKNADHVQKLLPSVIESGMHPVTNKVTRIQSSPVCNSTLLVLDRRYPRDAYKHPKLGIM